MNGSFIQQQAARILGGEYERVLNRCSKVVTYLCNKRWYHRGTVISGEGGAEGMLDTMLAYIVTVGTVEDGLREYMNYIGREYNVQTKHMRELDNTYEPDETILWTSLGEYFDPVWFKEIHGIRKDVDPTDPQWVTIKNILGP